MGPKQKKRTPTNPLKPWQAASEILLSVISLIGTIFILSTGINTSLVLRTFSIAIIWMIAMLGALIYKYKTTRRSSWFNKNFFLVFSLIILAGPPLIYWSNLPERCKKIVDPFPENKTGILVADFTEGIDLIESPEGEERAQETINNLKVRLLDDTIVVRNNCPIRSNQEAKGHAVQLKAKIIAWGELSKFVEGSNESIQPHFYINALHPEQLGELQIFESQIIGSDTDLPGLFSERIHIVTLFVTGQEALYSQNLDNYQVAFNKFRDAIQLIENSQETLSPIDHKILAVFYVLRAQAQSLLSNIPGALNDIEQAKFYDPNYAPAFVEAGNIFYSQGKDEKNLNEAKLQYQQAINMDDQSSAGYIGLGNTYYYLKNYTESINSFRKALSLKIKEEVKNEIRLRIAQVSLESGLEMDYAMGELAKVITSNVASLSQKNEAQNLLLQLQAKISETKTQVASSEILPTPSISSSESYIIGNPYFEPIQPAIPHHSKQDSFSAPGNIPALPATGFPFGKVSSIPLQPSKKYYDNSVDMILEIPKLSIQTTILGVPYIDNQWDVTWLGSNVGYLNQTTYPTHMGNSVITGHVWNADNTPGIFINLKDLVFGDQVLIKAWDEIYIFEVRENEKIIPTEISKVFEIKDEYSWITLLTCEGFTENHPDYFYRRIVQAVLIDVQ